MAGTDWLEVYSLLFAHYGMTQNEINNSSIPLIFGLLDKLKKRMCEKLGVPYNDTEEIEESEYEKEVDNEDIKYPDFKEIERNGERNKNVRKNNTPKTRSNKNINQKNDVINFFNGIGATIIED